MKLSNILILILLTFSCKNRYDVPSGIIQKDEMGALLWDIIQAQTFAKELHNRDSTLNLSKTSLALVDKVYSLHNVSKKEFDKSYTWYQSRPDVFRVVFDSLYTQQQRNNVSFLQKRYDYLKRDSLREKFQKNAKDVQ